MNNNSKTSPTTCQSPTTPTSARLGGSKEAHNKTNINNLPNFKQRAPLTLKPINRHRITKARKMRPAAISTTGHSQDKVDTPRSMEATLKRRTTSQQFASKIATLRLALCPLYPLPTGAPHPAFPATILSFWLLSEPQLDSLAAYYSQITRDEYTDQYPKPMDWDAQFLAEAPITDAQRVQIKRRKFGKFIGLRGCETPSREVEMRLETTRQRLRRVVEEEERKEKTMPMRRWW